MSNSRVSRKGNEFLIPLENFHHSKSLIYFVMFPRNLQTTSIPVIHKSWSTTLLRVYLLQEYTAFAIQFFAAVLREIL